MAQMANTFQTVQILHVLEVDVTLFKTFLFFKVSERDDTNAQLLASASRDGTIRVWQKDNDRPVSIFRVQATGKHGKQSRHEDYGKQRLWITLHWLRDQPTHFFSSGHKYVKIYSGCHIYLIFFLLYCIMWMTKIIISGTIDQAKYCSPDQCFVNFVSGF